jgi:hypothetical protein
MTGMLVFEISNDPMTRAILLSLLLSTSLFAADPFPSERILVPLLTEPVHGAFGSEFHTRLRIYNGFENDIAVQGIAPPCLLSACPIISTTIIEAGLEMGEIQLDGTPGRFISVLAGPAQHLAFHLRVHDVTRTALNFGTEIPVVREREMTTQAIHLIGVPADPRFRNTLRIYATDATALWVTFTDGVDEVRRTVTLVPGRDAFEPAYAMVSDFPAFASGAQQIKVTIEPLPTLHPLPQPPFWAFVSVTNNETQVITTITPQQ